jgi:hypothetical protein
MGRLVYQTREECRFRSVSMLLLVPPQWQQVVLLHFCDILKVASEVRCLGST